MSMVMTEKATRQEITKDKYFAVHN